MAGEEFVWGTGRRKSSVARVRLRRGEGAITVNGKPLDEYFPTERQRAAVLAPLKATEVLEKYEVIISAMGGGVSGQAGACVMGIARALVRADSALEGTLRDNHFLTRDARMKERKKYGRRGARRGFQFSKR